MDCFILLLSHSTLLKKSIAMNIEIEHKKLSSIKASKIQSQNKIEWLFNGRENRRLIAFPVYWFLLVRHPNPFESIRSFKVWLIDQKSTSWCIHAVINDAEIILGIQNKYLFFNSFDRAHVLLSILCHCSRTVQYHRHCKPLKVCIISHRKNSLEVMLNLHLESIIFFDKQLFCCWVSSLPPSTFVLRSIGGLHVEKVFFLSLAASNLPLCSLCTTALNERQLKKIWDYRLHSSLSRAKNENNWVKTDSGLTFQSKKFHLKFPLWTEKCRHITFSKEK